MTVATVIYYSGVHPYTLKPYKTVKDKEDKLNQRRFFFWYKRENHGYIRKTLDKANRTDLADQLIGAKTAGNNGGGQKRAPKWLEERRKKEQGKGRTSRSGKKRG